MCTAVVSKRRMDDLYTLFFFSRFFDVVLSLYLLAIILFACKQRSAPTQRPRWDIYCGLWLAII